MSIDTNIESNDSLVDKDLLSNNFVVSLYQVASKMETNSRSLSKGAEKREKELEESWKVINGKKYKVQREDLVGIYRNMALVSTLLLATSVAASVAGTALSTAGGMAVTGKLLGDLGNVVSNQGTTVANNVSGIYTQNANSLVEEFSQRSQKVWEGDKRKEETHKNELSELKTTSQRAIEDALNKASTVYSTVRV